MLALDAGGTIARLKTCCTGTYRAHESIVQKLVTQTYHTGINFHLPDANGRTAVQVASDDEVRKYLYLNVSGARGLLDGGLALRAALAAALLAAAALW